MKKTIIAVVITLVVSFLGGVIVTNVINSKNNEEEGSTITVDVLEELIKPADELISTKYHYKDIMNYDNGKKFLTHEKQLMIYKGTISVGVDISDVTFDVNNNSKKITVGIPAPRVIAHDCDCVESEKIQNSIFTDIDQDDLRLKETEFKKEQQETLMNDTDFIKSVNKNTEDVIGSFLNIPELTKDYTITFKHMPSNDQNDIGDI